MKTDHLKESNNIEVRRRENNFAQSDSTHLSSGLLRLLLAPGSFKSKIILILLLIFLGGGAGLSGIFDTRTSYKYESNQIAQQENTHVTDEEAKFVSKVLATTEEFWTQTFEKEGKTYHKPKLVFYTGQTRDVFSSAEHQQAVSLCQEVSKLVHIDGQNPDFMQWQKQINEGYFAREILHLFSQNVLQPVDKQAR